MNRVQTEHGQILMSLVGEKKISFTSFDCNKLIRQIIKKKEQHKKHEGRTKMKECKLTHPLSQAETSTYELFKRWCVLQRATAVVREQEQHSATPFGPLDTP